MKAIIFLLSFLISAANLSAQDTTLPQGKSRILLYSGKDLNDIHLWKIDTATIEYVIKGNLMDLKTAEVRSIETPESTIEFGAKNKLTIRKYDVIIPDVGFGDTILCFIQNVGRTTIAYLPVGKKTVRVIAKNSVKSYVRYSPENNTAPTNVIASSVYADSASGPKVKIIFPDDTTKHDNISAKRSGGYQGSKVKGAGRGAGRNAVLMTFGALLLLFL